MIIDKNKRFIFVHNPRTGGTSIRKALEDYQDHEKHEEVHKYFATTEFSKVSYSHVNHSGLHILSEVLDIEQYTYVFTCVRNPFSRIYSYYKNLINESVRHDISELGSYNTYLPSFTHTVRDIYEATKIRKYNLMSLPYDYWTRGVSEVIRFEDLANVETWNNLMLECGLGFPHYNIPQRPHENDSKSKFQEYRRYYTDDTRKMVHEMFQKDIETYGYKF
jgi:hypothetical protein